MNNDNLYDVFGDISSKHIEEARDYRPARSPVWVKLVALFICLFLIVGGGIVYIVGDGLWAALRMPDDFRELIVGGDKVLMYIGTNVMIDGASYEYCPEDVTSAFKLRFFRDELLWTNDIGEKWYSIEGESNLEYLIRKGKDGWHSLWVFSYTNKTDIPKAAH